jgi:hypothetical protein
MTDTPLVVKQPTSPGEFLAAQQRYLHIMYLDNHAVDIDGQLAHGQYATAALLGRVALERGIVIHLMLRGLAAGLTDHNVWTRFRAACGTDPLFSDALTLAMGNPVTEEDSRTFARDCLTFVRERLEIEASGYHSPEAFADYTESVKGMGQLVRLVRGKA